VRRWWRRRWSRESDVDVIAAFRARVRAETIAELARYRRHRLATEDDAVAWGFEPDWMAAERVELYWNHRAGG
jgi:hypothetical protein